MAKDIEEADRKVKEMRKRLANIKKQAGKIDIPIPRGILKKGVKKVISILKKMVENDVDEYRETGVKKIGNVKVEHALKMGFLDEGKEKNLKKDRGQKARGE